MSWSDGLIGFISYPPIPIWEVGSFRFSLHGVFAALGFMAGAWIATREFANADSMSSSTNHV